MPPKSLDVEVAISKASEAMDKDPKLKGTKAALRYGAPYDRLIRRRQGRRASNTRGGHNKKLSVPQDGALKDYIMMLYSAGTSANLDEIHTAASRLLYYVLGDPKSAPSRWWTKAWITQNKDFLKTLKTKPIFAKRLGAHIVEDIKAHFANFN
jgi:hypothetical protein